MSNTFCGGYNVWKSILIIGIESMSPEPSGLVPFM
jgi:hypothetical protein